jgi:hypothetical protein
MEEKQVLFSQKHNLVFIFNPLIIWNTYKDKHFLNIFDAIYKVFELNYVNINKNFEICDSRSSLATVDELSIIGQEQYNSLVKIGLIKNPYTLLAENFLISLNDSNLISKENFYKFIMNQDLKSYTNSFYTSSKDGEDRIDFEIDCHKIYKDLTSLMFLYNERTNLLDDIKDNKNFFDMISNFSFLYNQEIIDYLRPHFECDEKKYNYTIDLLSALGPLVKN